MGTQKSISRSSAGQELAALRRENEDLRARLDEAEEALRAIRAGEVDALVLSTPQGEQVYTLQGADQTYRTIIEQMQEGAVTLVTDGAIQYANRAFADLLQRPLEDVIGSQLKNHIAPEDQPVFAGFVEQALQGSAQGELSLLRRSGTPVPVHVGLTALVTSGVSSLCLVVSDLTAHRTADLARSEAQLRAVLNAFPDAIVMTDDAGTYVEANGEVRQVFGVSRGQLLGRSVREFLDGEASFEQFWSALLREGRLHKEHQLRRADGGTITVECFAVANVLPGRHLKVIRDITQRKQWEQSLQHAKAEAERANRVKDDFLAVLSHELRTPLTAILAWVGMLQVRKYDEETSRKGLAVIERNVNAQTRLIEDLLDVSRIIAGKMKLVKQPVDLSKVVYDTVEGLKPVAATKQVALEAILPTTPVAFLADPARIQQVVSNLISNAVKFTPSSGQVMVVLRVADNRAEITVTDTGKGIKPEFLPYLFNRFSQEDSSTTRQHTGLGLGLALAHSIVSMHGGSIGAESEGENRGATFRVCLPLSPIRPEVSATGASSEAGTLQGIRVLLVEDEADVREVLVTCLRVAGAVTAEAATMSEALEAVPSFRPTVLLSDIGLPLGDGYTLLKELRKLEQQRGWTPTPAVALTGHAQPEDADRCREAGYLAHLSKPVEPELLVGTVCLALQR